MLITENKILNDLLGENDSFRMNFEKLVKAFEKRVWTPETCLFFKTLLCDLFRAYGIPVNVHIFSNIDGDGRFDIEFIEEEIVQPPKKPTLIEKARYKIRLLKFVFNKINENN